MKCMHKSWPVQLITIARAFTVGLAYWLVSDIPGLTSSFVAIFVALLPFDIIIAMPKFSLRLAHWQVLFSIILPHVSATAITLGKGLILGLLFGGLSMVGMPVFLGAVFTIGIAYNIGLKTKGNISSYVGMLAGIQVFDQIIRLPVLTQTLFADIGRTGLRVFYGTFTALFVGWICGVGVGIIIRLFLPRGYRTISSSAYAQPLDIQPFREVLHTNDDLVLIKATVGSESTLAGQTLAEANLRTLYQASIMSIHRKPKDVVAPRGLDCILTGDILVMLMPSVQVSEVLELVKGSGASEQI